MSRRFEFGRWLALLAILAVVVGACRRGGEEDASSSVVTVTAATTSTVTVQPPPSTSPVVEPSSFLYNVAILGDIQTDNPWASMEAVSDPWARYILQPTIPTLYRSRYPNYTLTPWLAGDIEPPTGFADGDNWVIDVNLRPGLVWSDGSPLTAHDVAFTFRTVVDLGLTGDYVNLFPLAFEDDPNTPIVDPAHGIIAVEAVSDVLVRYTWSSRPGLAQWHFGAAQGPIFSEAFWGSHVASAATKDELFAVSGVGAPSGGAMVFDSRDVGSSINMIANANAIDGGSVNVAYGTGGFVSSNGAFDYEVGDISGEVVAAWDEGPNASAVTFTIYETQEAAVQALITGDVDYILNPAGLQKGLQAVVMAASDLEEITNPANLFRYLAFNTRRFPGSDTAFRQAMACVIDKEFVATDILADAAIALDSVVPQGNTFWANPNIVSWCEGQTREDRVESATKILKDAGWTWTVEPEWNEDNLDVFPEGQGLRGPNGETMSELELLAPVSDPLRSTFALYIEEWAKDLGIPVSTELTSFSVMVDRIFGPTDWDMYILGWVDLGTYPDYLVDFFESAEDSASGGFNIPGYSNAEFDLLVDEFKAAPDVDAAAALVREMDAIIARDVPYVVLFTTPIFEAYRASIEFPTTTVLDGLQGFGGLAGLVHEPQ